AAAREDHEAAEEAAGAGIGAESDRVRGDGVAHPHAVPEHERAADRSHGASIDPYSRAQRRPLLAEDRVFAEQRLAEGPIGCDGDAGEAENGDGQDAARSHPLTPAPRRGRAATAPPRAPRPGTAGAARRRAARAPGPAASARGGPDR